MHNLLTLWDLLFFHNFILVLGVIDNIKNEDQIESKKIVIEKADLSKISIRPLQIKYL